MNNPKRILHIDLTKRTFGMHYMPELVDYVGGVTMGMKLISMYKGLDPIVIAIGPLNGYFPFASKTCFITENDGVIEDLYIGGSLSFRIRYAGLDAIVVTGAGSDGTLLDITDGLVTFVSGDADSSTIGLPGKRSVLSLDKGGLVLDGYFGFPSGILEKKFISKKLLGFVITGTKVFDITNIGSYNQLFNQLIGERSLMLTEIGSFPSCSGCPMGCQVSKEGEMGGNILLHSLVACEFSENIYSNLGVVFACLDFLGYKYTHEHLETLSELFSKTMKEIE